MNNARNIAVSILEDILVNGAYSNLSIDKFFKLYSLSDLDKRFVTELVYGTVKYKLKFDYIINQFSDIDIKKMDSYVKFTFYISLYQLFHMDRVPDRAIVHEAVIIAKSRCKKNKQTDKFVNAVLRQIIRERDNIVWPDKRRNYNSYLSKFYSFPQWILEEWGKDYKKESLMSLCNWMNKTPNLWIRCNTLKISPAELMHKLKLSGLDVRQHEIFKEAILLSHSGNIKNIPGYYEGDFVIQDLSSMIVSLALEPNDNDYVLDCCAAPGGKTTHLAALMNNTGKIIACDLHQHRINLVDDNCIRLGVNNVDLHSLDVNSLEYSIGSFDKILVDAPCSGLGVLNRRSDLRWKKHKSDLDSLQKIQSDILDTAYKLLKPNGILVYSTCTISFLENEKQIDNFLSKYQDMKLEEFPVEIANYFKNDKGIIKINPLIYDMDAFFIAKLRKI